MENSIKKLFDELTEIENKLIDEINQIIDNTDFNDTLIDLITKYPEQKQLIKFIIYINDNLSNKQIKNRDIIVDTITKLIDKKKKILELIEKLHKPQKPKKSKISLEFLKNIPPAGYAAFVGIFGLILLFIFLIIHPEKTKDIAEISAHVKGLK